MAQGWAGMTFGHLGTGTGMAQPIPKLWEREREWKISFPTFGNGNGKIPFPIFGNGNGNSIPAFREREWDVVIRVNDREWERELHRKIEWKFFIISLLIPLTFCIVIIHRFVHSISACMYRSILAFKSILWWSLGTPYHLYHLRVWWTDSQTAGPDWRGGRPWLSLQERE